MATYDEAWAALNTAWESQADRGQHGWIWDAPEDLGYTTTRNYDNGRLWADADWLDFRIRFSAKIRPVEPREASIERRIVVAWGERNEMTSSRFRRGEAEIIDKINRELGVVFETRDCAD